MIYLLAVFAVIITGLFIWSMQALAAYEKEFDEQLQKAEAAHQKLLERYKPKGNA